MTINAAELTIPLKPFYDGDQPLKFCVTGTPRSGTKRITTALRAAGVHCNHESNDGRDAIVDWMWLFREQHPDRVGRVIVQIREPLPCIRSIAVHRFEIQEWFCTIAPVSMSMNPIQRAARFYLFWNRMLLSIADNWYRLEDDEACLQMFADIGVGLTEEHLAAGNENRNELRHDLLTDDDHKALDRFENGDWIEDIDCHTCYGLREFSKEHGYEI